jgi:hypothetical protein
MRHYEISFYKLIQHSQAIGTGDDHAIVSVQFGVTINTFFTGQFTAEIKQSVGSVLMMEPLELRVPPPQRVPVPYDVLRHAANHYFRICVGPTARGIRLGPGCSATMYGNVFNFPLTYVADVPFDGQGGW